MRLRQVAVLLITSAAAIAEGQSQNMTLSSECVALKQSVMTRVTNRQFAEGEKMLLGAYTPGTDHAVNSCVGIILNDIAILMSASGDLAETERLAERWIAILEPLYPPHDPILLSPLQIVAAARFEQGKIGSAREAVRKIQLTRVQRPEESAAVHAWTGSFLYVEGRRAEAEQEYLSALQALKIAGHSNSADAGAILITLGSVYIEEHHLDEAQRVLDDALAVFEQVIGAGTVDWIRLLNLRGVLYARQGKWKEAEHELHEAISLADSAGFADPAVQRDLLRTYSQVLRRNHNKGETKEIEKRLSALQAAQTNIPVVDVSELLSRPKSYQCVVCGR
jgi:tetratricopeptide (TPR) repeat protein